MRRRALFALPLLPLAPRPAPARPASTVTLRVDAAAMTADLRALRAKAASLRAAVESDPSALTAAFDAELAAARAMGPAAYRAKFKQVAAYMEELAASPEAVSKLARRFRTAPSVATAVSSSSAARNGLSLARAADGTAIPPAACDHPPLQHLHPVSNTLLHGTEETTDACQGRGNLCRERGNECHGC